MTDPDTLAPGGGPDAPPPIALEDLATDVRRMCGAFVLDAPPHDADRPHVLRGRVAGRVRGGLEVARIAQNTAVIHRGRAELRRDPGEHFFLVRQIAGTAAMAQGDACVRMRPGDMILVDAAAPSRFVFDGRPSDQVSLHLPRAAMVARFGARIGGGIAIPREDRLGQAMRCVMDRMLRDGGPHLGEAFLGVLGAFLVDRVSDAEAGGSLHARALEAMTRSHADPTLSVRTLADRMGVTPRSVQRAFAAVGDAPAERLSAIRAGAARAALRSGRAVTAAQAGYAAGFADLSTFYRNYRARYGETPAATLRAGVARCEGGGRVLRRPD